MKTLARTHSGFALLAAIGVLAVLTILVMSAATAADVTHHVVQFDVTDFRLAAAIENAAVRLEAGDIPGADIKGPERTVPVPAEKVGPGQPIEVTVTTGLAPADNYMAPALHARDGDTMVKVVALMPGAGGKARDTMEAMFLLNTAGKRSARILLQEKRK
ncbi:MAG: hypothetical protein K1X53_02750 [Candidatus Sumerlaeaceae bacterium]|nr:hypothetical protein [Candidatus Sumerlaeaceae bacterium]